jgi:hypothetical protein
LAEEEVTELTSSRVAHLVMCDWDINFEARVARLRALPAPECRDQVHRLMVGQPCRSFQQVAIWGSTEILAPR